MTEFKEGDRVTGLGGGGYREYIVMEPDKTCRVPDNLKDEDAIVEPLACLLSAAMKMPWTTLGDPVAVVGAGYMGLGMDHAVQGDGLRRHHRDRQRPERARTRGRMGRPRCLLRKRFRRNTGWTGRRSARRT